jgi:hypothetical protein
MMWTPKHAFRAAYRFVRGDTRVPWDERMRPYKGLAIDTYCDRDRVGLADRVTRKRYDDLAFELSIRRDGWQ